MRTALHNGYSNVASLCASLEVPCSHDCFDLLTEHSSLFWKLALEAPRLAQPIKKNLYTMADSSSPYLCIDDTVLARPKISRSFRYCPKCLAGELITVFQDIKAFKICPFHQVLIIEQCPQCGKRERWVDAHLLFCSCGFDRRNTPNTATTFIDTNKLETFGKNAYTKKLSVMIPTAEACDEIWNSRKPSEDGTPPYLLASIYKHAEAMINFQINRFPGFTQRMHLAPWTSSNSKLKSFIYRMVEDFTCASDCSENSCCTMISLLPRELNYFVGGRNFWPSQKIFFIENFEETLDTYHNKYYTPGTKICELVKSIDKKNLQLKLERKALSDTSVTIREAKNLIKCNIEIINTLTNNGYLHTTSTPDRGHLRLITKLSIEAFKTDFILLNEISSLLNTSKTKTSRILKKHNITPHDDKLTRHVYKRSIIITNFNRLVTALTPPSRTTSPLEMDTPYNLTINQAAALLHVSGRLLHRRFISTGVINPLLIMGEYRLSSNQIKEIETHLQNNLSITQISDLLECNRKKTLNLINNLQLKHSFAISLPNGKIQLFYNKKEAHHLIKKSVKPILF